ncbi:MAG TPA: nucleoside 2-deoxyribosyltransferase [Oculatellaceae cyanobacterium]|jgi:nucleoside 2-deoxyribosyltransferase
MLSFTERVYFAAPFEHPAEVAFNNRVAALVRAYNFPLFMPQEVRGELHAQGLTGEELDERLMEVCMDVLSRASLVIAVFYGEEFDPLTAFEVGYALGRRTNVVAVRNTLEPELFRRNGSGRHASPHICSRIVVAPHDDERFPDRLIPILNRYFVAHKL